jgi:quinoprotein glucose dehydrogenase
MILQISVGLFALVGLAYALPGFYLGWLGGSWAYLLTGLGMLAVAGLLWRRSAWALVAYAVLLGAVLAWAVGEVGLDWYRLAPRGWLPVVMGLWLLLPAIRRRLTPAPRLTRSGWWPTAALLLALTACTLVALQSILVDPQQIAGKLRGDIVNPDPATGADFPDDDWHVYGRGAFGQRWSPLDQITPANLGALTEVWRYRTGDLRRPDDVTETTYQVTPLKVGTALYLCTPHNIAIALDAATGAELWRFDAHSGLEPDRQHQTCRGVTYWADPAAEAGAACAARVYMPTADARLIALDAATGQKCATFGQRGEISLLPGMPYQPDGYYYSTSPPVAVDDRIIIGGAVNDNFSVQSPSGVIRAFDILTGELLWNWDSGNPDQSAPIDIAGGETYTPNSPNSWSVFSYDPGLGLVYIPLGNKVPDQLGQGRSPAVEAHASSVVALDIATGQKRWVFQTVRHDLWDMDVPAQPVLVDLDLPQGRVPALVQPTKQGDIYVLNRATGEPLLPVSERPAPSGAIGGEWTAPTQPVSALSFEPPELTEADMWGVTPFDQLACRIQFHLLNYRGRYTPPSLEGTIVHPGNFGVFNWGSVAVDPVRQVMFGMPTALPFTVRLVAAEDMPPKGDEKASEQGLNRNEGAAYGVYMGPFLGPLQVPCSAPPWGWVAGADLRTGEVVWKRRNGTVRDMTPLPLPFRTGVPGIGGPIITAGGVAFLAASVDDYLRGYDLTSGTEIWRARLPAGGQATPMTYAVDGRQYVVIVAGGHGSVGTKAGDYVIAYALSDAAVSRASPVEQTPGAAVEPTQPQSTVQE